MLTTGRIDDFVRYSRFSSPDGYDEYFMTIECAAGISFPAALEELSARYSSALDQCSLRDGTVAFSRIFLSDLVNQKPELVSSPIFGRLASGALSAIEQKPLHGGPVSLFSYHIRGANGAISRQCRRSGDNWGNDALLTGRNYSLLFTANGVSDRPDPPYVQSKQLFDSMAGLVADQNMTVPDTMIRTWIFLRDVDLHYGDMVRARKEFFAAVGLTEKNHFLASTGIQGRSFDPRMLLSLDSLSITPLRAGQVRRIEAPEYLSPTTAYGVTFERGLEVVFGDRSHLYISGTASINNRGEVLHIGDVEAQTRRTLENVRALLATRNAGVNDLAYIIAYARNFHDRKRIDAVLCEESGGNTPIIFVEAPVCRPSWLVELEGMAIIPGASEFPAFL